MTKITIKNKQNKITTQEVEMGNIESSLNYFLKFNIPKDAKSLDVGCNLGSLIFNLYNLGYKNVFGSEVDKNAVEKGKIAYPKISNNLNVHKHGNIPFKNDSFDVVLMFDVIEHIPDVHIFLKNEVYRVLKKRGIFMFQTPNKPMNILWVYLDNRSFKVEWWKEHCSLQTFWSLKKLFIDAGFNNTIIEKYNVWTEHNKNKVKRKLGFIGLILLKFISILPIYIYTNFWGYTKK